MSETRAQRRIRQAVESRGYAVESLNYEAIYNAGEMQGLGGGWTLELDRPFAAHSPDSDLGGYSVDEVLAEIDYWLPPDGPCDCDRTHDPMMACRVKNDPQKPTHGPECRYHLNYRLRWWNRPAA